jgi:hypothetical protein
MHDPRIAEPDAAGPLRVYERWPVLHLVIAAGIVVAGLLNRTWLAANPTWFWFLFAAIPILAVHEWEEFRFPGGFRQWYNTDLCRSNDANAPLTAKEAAINHMPLMLLFPLLAVLASRWPWIGLVGIYALLADAMFHTSATGYTRRYSPGLVTALLLYLPLAFAATWFLVSNGDVSLAALLAAAFAGTVGFNIFLFLPLLRTPRPVDPVAGPAPPAHAPAESGTP